MQIIITLSAVVWLSHLQYGGALPTLPSSLPTTTRKSGFQVLQLQQRQPNTQDILHPVNSLMRRMVGSQTVQAMDSITAGLIQFFGGVVDELGDFVVETIEELPGAIDRVSQSVSDAVTNGREQVIISVRGLRPVMDTARNVTRTTSDAIQNAFQGSETQDSLRTLEERVGAAMGRIFGVSYKNAGRIDNALATSLRRLMGGGRDTSTTATTSARPFFEFRGDSVATTERPFFEFRPEPATSSASAAKPFFEYRPSAVSNSRPSVEISLDSPLDAPNQKENELRSL